MKRMISRILAILLIAFSFLCSQTVYAVDTPNMNRRILVAMGDSYSAGEGIPPFFDQDESLWVKVKKENWLAHRSEKAWSGMLRLPTLNGQIITLSESHYDGTNGSNACWFFVAASGAETRHIAGGEDKHGKKEEGKQYKPYAQMIDAFAQKDAWLPVQSSVFEQELTGENIDYVTITIGGNDAGFVDIMSEASLGCDMADGTLTAMIKDALNYIDAETYHDSDGNQTPGLKKKLKSVYTNIWEKTGKKAKIIVAGYPHLVFSNIEDLNSVDSFGNKLLYAQESPIGFNYYERTALNGAVDDFNQRIEETIGELQSKGMPIWFVPVTEEFSGHEPGTSVPYLNGVVLLQDQDLVLKLACSDEKENLKPNILSAYSFHPNEAGAHAYATCVQKKINEIEGLLDFGYCGGEKDGKNCAWFLNTDGVLTIKGQGRMADCSFTDDNMAPWFPRISEIKSIIVEDGVEYIGESAFAACGPSSVQLADSVLEIGANAFNACFGFEELILPQNLTVIGESAFSNSKIKHITIPDLVTEIGPSAFTGCFSLEKADILGALTDLNKSFFMCSGLRELSLPESLSSIGELVLSGCDSLTDIYYAGSESQWNRIAIHADNDETLQHVTVHYGKSDSAAPSVEADEIPGPDNASQYSASFIIDEAHVLTEQQLRELDTRAAEISRQTKCSVTVVTVDDYWDYGSSVETAAENLFDRYRFGTGGDRSAILLLLSMTERDYDLYAHGDLPRVVFSEQGMTELADAFLPALGDDHWDDGIQQYLDKASQMLQHESGNSSSGLENDPETQPSTDPQSGSAHFYELFANVADTWEDAERYCESLGGHLATITSPEENAYVFELACDHGIDAYIGLTDKTNEGVWEWITGEPVNYQNWAPHEPNAENPNEDYAMFYHKYTDGTWNDGDFGGKTVNGGTAFICEWDSVSAYEAYLDKKEIPLPPDLSLESQQLLLEQNRSLWAFQPYDHWAYTFTDLDHNGRLEVLAYSIQGSGLFTYIHLWEISEDGEGLTNCLEGWKWTECAGIAQKQLLCYYDAAFGQYYYVFEGNTRDGSEHLDYTWSALTLKDGHAERIILAKKAVEHYPKDNTRFTDSNGNSISEYDYDHTVDQRFGNMRQSYLTLDWIWV